MLQNDLPPHMTMRLLIGGDQMKEFGNWKTPEKIVEIADPLVMVRPPDTRESLLASVSEPHRGFWASRFVDVAQMDITSSEVRRRVAASEPYDDLVGPEVAQYIRSHRLYRK